MIIPSGSIVVGRSDGAKALLNLVTGQLTPLQADDPTPVSHVNAVVDNPPPEPDVHPTTRADVIALYEVCLKREPEDEGAITGRLGRPYAQVVDEICNSPEAKAIAGEVPVGPVGPEGPPGGPAPVGPAGPTGPQGGSGSSDAHIPTADEIAKIWADLQTRLHESVDAAGTDIKRTWDELTQAVGVVTQQATKIIQTTSAAVEKRIGATLGTAVPDLLSLMGAGLGGVESLVGAFLSNAADVGDIAKAFSGEFKGESDNLHNWIVGTVGAILAENAAGALTAFEDRTPTPAPPLGPAPAAGEELGPELDIPPNPLNPPGSAVQGLSSALEIALGAIRGAFSLLDPGAELMSQYAWSNAPIRVPDAATATAAEVRGYISEALAHELARRSGIDAPAHAIERELARTRPGADALFTGYFRGHVDIPELDRGLLRLGYDPRAREIVTSAAFSIADVGSMIRTAERGGGSSGMPDVVGGDDELTDALRAELFRAGYSEPEAATLWRAHYRPLDPASAAEAIHRGHLAPEAYPVILRANGIAPFARDLMERILYAPYSRRDLLRLVKLGLLDHAELVAAVMAIGYDAEKAETLATMFERLAGDDAEIERKAVRRELQSHVVSRFKAGGLERSDAASHLAELGVSPAEVEALLLGAELDAENERQAKLEKLARPFYVDGLWDENITRGMLAANDVSAGRIDRLIGEWDYERVFATLKKDHQTQRDLTKDELATAFVARAIDEPTYTAHLTELGYDAAEVNTLLTLAMLRQHKEDLADDLKAIEHLVKIGQLTEGDASARLDKIGVKPGERDRLLDAWYKQKVLNHSELTFGQITDLAKAQLIDEEKADELLRRLPYSDEDRVLLLALMGFRVAQQEAKDQAAAEKAARAAAGKVVVTKP